jgi:hypothetical protein
MHKFANTMNLSLVFISDGQDNYPDDEVEEMKKIKT